MKATQENRVPPVSKDAGLVHSEVEVKYSGADNELRDSYDGDEDLLARLGKKQVLKVKTSKLRSIR